MPKAGMQYSNTQIVGGLLTRIASPITNTIKVVGSGLFGKRPAPKPVNSGKVTIPTFY